MNVLTSLEQAVDLVQQIDHPAVQTMLDTHNAVAETVPYDQLIKKYARYIRHVHVNEMDGRRPGTGSYDFAHPNASVEADRLQGLGFARGI
ncbi:MAG: sugar phosphate isomerase/epimerase family protein [Bryobacteraceae bacterium]